MPTTDDRAHGALSDPRLTWRIPDDRRLPALDPYADDVRRTAATTARETVWDTDDGRLRAERVELARQADGTWTVDRGQGHGPEPIRSGPTGPDPVGPVPADPDPAGSGDTVPRGPVEVFLRGRPVDVVGVRDTTTSLVRLHSRGGLPRVEVADVRVDEGGPDGPLTRTARWWVLADDGSDRTVVRRIERALADAADGPGLVPGPDEATDGRPGRRARSRSDRTEARTRSRTESRTESRTDDGTAAAFVVGALVPLRAALVAVDPRVRADDRGAVHDLRKVLRRIRSVLATYRGALDRDATEALRADLRAMSRIAGTARDAEVLRAGLLRSAARAPEGYVDHRTLDRLGAHLDELREAAAADLRRALDTAEWFRTLDALDALLADAPAGVRATTHASAFVARRVRRDRKRVATALDAADHSDDLALLHGARKAARRLRYSLEAARGVGDVGKRRLGRLRRIQESLGDALDAAHAADAYAQVATLARRVEEDTFGYGALATAERAVVDERLGRATAQLRAFRRRLPDDD